MPKMLRKYQLKGIKSQRKNYKNICRLFLDDLFFIMNYHNSTTMDNTHQGQLPVLLRLQENRAIVCQAENNRVDHFKINFLPCCDSVRVRSICSQAGALLVQHLIQKNAE